MFEKIITFMKNEMERQKISRTVMAFYVDVAHSEYDKIFTRELKKGPSILTVFFTYRYLGYKLIVNYDGQKYEWCYYVKLLENVRDTFVLNRLPSSLRVSYYNWLKEESVPKLQSFLDFCNLINATIEVEDYPEGKLK